MNRTHIALSRVLASLGFAGLVSTSMAQDVSLVRRFAAWNDPVAWSDGAAASSGKSYVVDATGQDLTSPRAFSPAFPGASLAIQSGGNLDLRHCGGSASIADLTLSGGAITHGAGRTVGVGGLNEVLTVTEDSSIVVVRTSQTLEVRSRLTGAGGLTAQGASVEPGDRATIALLGVGSDYAGEWTVSNVTLNAVTPGSMGSGNVTITEGTLDFDYRYNNPAGTLTIQGTESRLLLDQDIAFGQAFFGETPLPDGVHPWSFFDGLGAGEQILDGGGRLIIGDQDADDDGMPDVLETEIFGDMSKAADADEDSDGLSNASELAGNSDPTKADTDEDGLNDGVEVAAGSDPRVADTDGDGVSDQVEVETELTNPRSVDTDGDTLSDGDEIANGTKPLLADSDADGFDDGTELAAGSDPNNADDKPSGSFIPAQVEIGAPVLLDVIFDGGDPIATKEANMAFNTDEPEILFVTTATDGALKDPVTGEDSQQAVVGFFMDPRTLEQTRDPFVILGNPDGELKRVDVKYNPVSKQYVVVSAARGYRPNGQDLPLIAFVNPNSVAGGEDPVAQAFVYDGQSTVSYDDVAVAVSTNNGNILVVGEHDFAGEGEGVVGAMFDKDGNVLTPTFTRLDRLQAIGDEDDPDVLFLPNNDVFVFLVNTDGDGADDLLDRITGSVIQPVPDGDGNLQLGDQVVLGGDRLEGVAEGHPAAIENPFTNELIGALDYSNGANGGDIFYFQVGDAPTFELTTTRDQIPYLEATGSDPYQQRHPQLAADPNSGVIVVGHHVLSSAADPPLPNGYALTVLGPDGAVLPGRNELNNGFHAFLENEDATNNDANWTNVKYDPLSDSFIVVFADNGGETKVVRFTVVSNHLEQPTVPEPEPDGPLYREDFEGLTLGPNVDEEVEGEMVWTNEPPEGWDIDNSMLFGADEEGIGVTEWKGWTFADKDWWVEAAGDQRRSEWLSGKGTVAIADPDEWDDLGSPGGQEQGGFNSFMSLPPISLVGLGANTAVLSFDSSWRPEFDDNYHQSGNAVVSFDGGEPVELFEWLSDPGSPNFKGEAIDERAIVPLNNPEGAQSMVITIGMFDAGNDWWWAIDNIEVATGAVLSKIVGRRSRVLLEITDTGSSEIDEGSVVLQVDGQTVAASVSKADGVVSIEYAPAPPFVSGSQHAYVIQASDEAGAAVSFEGTFDVPIPALPEDPLPGPVGVDGEFGVRYIWGSGTMGNLGNAVDAIQAVEAGTWEGASFDITHAYINHGSGAGLFGEDDPYADEVVDDEDGLWSGEDFVQFAKGTIRVSESGDYTFGVQTDDGFALRIFGAEFSRVQGNGQLDPGNANTMAHPGTTGNSSTRGVVTLAKGDYDIEFMWYERGGGDFGELYLAKGAFDGDGDTDTWQLLGKPADGETAFVTLVGSPLVLPEITLFRMDGADVTLNFSTPDPSVSHALEQSIDLLDWDRLDTEELVDAADGFTRSFQYARPADAAAHFRVAVLPPPALLSADFEDGPEGWTVENAAGDTVWELGTPNAGGLTTAASGVNAWGTAIDGSYGVGTITSLKSPVIDLTGIGRPKLSFNYFVDTTEGVEGGQLRFLDETGGELFTRQEIFSGKTDTWTPFSLTVPREARDQKIILEFRFLSDATDDGLAGWYLDDVVVDR